MHTKLFLVFFLLMSCVSAPSRARADGDYLYVNHALIANNTFNVNERLLVIRIDMENFNYEVPQQLQLYNSPKNEAEAAICYFDGKRIDSVEMFQLDCGLSPLSIKTDGWAPVIKYVFRMKGKNNDWYELLGANESQSFWIRKENSPNISFEIIFIGKWVEREGGLVMVNQDLTKKVNIYAKPDAASEIIGQCHSFGGGTGLLSIGLLKDDWVKVFCEEIDCYNEGSPNHPEWEDDIKGRAEWKNQKACISGWTPWRSDKGRILLFPRIAYTPA